MKRYISAILVPCLLLQLCGCYSLKEISLEELPYQEEAFITTKDSSIYHLKKILDEYEMLTTPDVYFSNEWRIIPEIGMINLNTQTAYKINNSEIDNYSDYGDWDFNRGWALQKDTTSINFNEITKVSVERLNSITTGLVVLVVLLFIASIFIGASLDFPFDEYE